MVVEPCSDAKKINEKHKVSTYNSDYDGCQTAEMAGYEETITLMYFRSALMRQGGDI